MSTLRRDFAAPPAGFGPVPLWWWVGEPLVRERLLWQLDQMHEGGLAGACVIYHHVPTDSSLVLPGDPPLFSAAWWDLFRWVLDRCAERRMSLWFSGYIIENGTLRALPDDYPDMRGRTLVYDEQVAGSSSPVRVAAPPGAELVAVVACPEEHGCLRPESGVVLLPGPSGQVVWEAPREGWRLCRVAARPEFVSTIHPRVGELMVERFFGLFEQHCPEAVGKTFRGFFTDEVWAGTPWKWSGDLAPEFCRRKGYDLLPWLPALWRDVGPRTPKVRLDYYDVVCALMEERLFRPVFAYNEARGLLHGHDQGGRCSMLDATREYIDYYRANRWYSAPGYDDSGDRPIGERNFRDAKLASSIASVYGRPRVWFEAFHSSGWGVTPAQMTAWVNENVVYGATLYDKHGLYYTTYGGWWEWAPPDAHFRQPYWLHAGALSGYTARLCRLLSDGKHRCDVAVLYPSATTQAGMAGDSFSSAAQAADRDGWDLPQALFRQGIDFDYVDDDSIAAAQAADGTLRVNGLSYRVLLCCSTSVVRFSTLEKALELGRAGGLVIAYGCLPEASDRAGAEDPRVAQIVRVLFGDSPGDDTAGAGAGGVFIRNGYAGVAAAIARRIDRDFTASEAGICVLHRVVDEHDAYLVFNSRPQRVSFQAAFRAAGVPELWDAWTGQLGGVRPVSRQSGTTVLSLDLEGGEAQLVVFAPAAVPQSAAEAGAAVPEGAQPVSRDLGSTWEVTLEPVLDNRWGDFGWPIDPDRPRLGAEARRFRHRQEWGAVSGWESPSLDDSDWASCLFSHGPFMWKLGPIPPGVGTDALEKSLLAGDRLDPLQSVEVADLALRWLPVVYSQRWGIERDPLLAHWGTGPHGLKKAVPDEFIDLGHHAPGSCFYLWTAVRSLVERDCYLSIGGGGPVRAWLAGAPAADEQGCWPVRVPCGTHPFLMRIEAPAEPRLLNYSTQPCGLRAFAAFGREASVGLSPAARWIWHPEAAEPSVLRYFRRCFTLPEVPGAATLLITAERAYSVWVNGQLVSRDSNWRNLERCNVTGALRPGANVVAAEVMAGPNAAGLIADLQMAPSGQGSAAGRQGLERIVTDDRWCSSTSALAGWRQPGYDDSGWVPAHQLGPLAAAPWGAGAATWIEDRFEPESLGLRWFAGPDAVAFDPLPDRGPQAEWFRFVAPPGVRALHLTVFGRPRLWLAGEECALTQTRRLPDGAGQYRALVRTPQRERAVAALRLQTEPGRYGGAAIPEPIAFDCGPGLAPLGDWSQLGLGAYSGAVRYRRWVRIPPEQLCGRLYLGLGSVVATARVFVNGRLAGTRIAPPWRVDITTLVRAGDNLVEIQVANTLANHLSEGTPTPYVVHYPGQTAAGLFGPVSLELLAVPQARVGA